MEFSADGLAFVYVPNSAAPEIAICEFYPSEDSNKVKEFLLTTVIRNNLQKTRCNWVLHPDYYRIMLMSAPDIPESEYKTALRWQVKDIVNFPLEDTSVDIFYPDDNEKLLKKLYVIAAQTSFLQTTVNTIRDCQLIPDAIDIREFAIRNLLSVAAPAEESIGFLHLTNDNCLFVTVQNHKVQFVRRIPLGLKNLNNEMHNQFSVELRRSFNYCDIELRQETPRLFYLQPSANVDQTVAENIAKSLDIEVKILDVKTLVSAIDSVEPAILTQNWAAIGGALRK